MLYFAVHKSPRPGVNLMLAYALLPSEGATVPHAAGFTDCSMEDSLALPIGADYPVNP